MERFFQNNRSRQKARAEAPLVTYVYRVKTLIFLSNTNFD